MTVATQLIARLDRRGRTLTGDALFCRQGRCKQVVAAGGGYLFLVKGNQPALHDEIRERFAPPFPTPPADRCEARTVDHRHGRCADTRQLAVSTDLTSYSAWSALAQVFRLHRHQAGRYRTTSLPSEIASAERLLALRRGYWVI